ncbi:MAG: hypothetical protein PHE89_04040 [Alphaproteobacteria bacterium]|nr:hypothetical protein [Alphaproteobacteria bacterium]
MIFNKTLGREIPERWDVKKLRALVKSNKKKTEPNRNKRLIDLSVMPGGTMCLNRSNDGNAFETNMFEMQKFSLLFGSIRPYLKKSGFAPFDGLVAGTIHSFSPLCYTDWNFIALTLTSESIFDHAITSSKGTKMPVVSADELLDYHVAYSQEVIGNFNHILAFRDIIAKNIQENAQLAKLRDFLLPMLMNGQVSAG